MMSNVLPRKAESRCDGMSPSIGSAPDPVTDATPSGGDGDSQVEPQANGEDVGHTSLPTDTAVHTGDPSTGESIENGADTKVSPDPISVDGAEPHAREEEGGEGHEPHDEPQSSGDCTGKSESPMEESMSRYVGVETDSNTANATIAEIFSKGSSAQDAKAVVTQLLTFASDTSLD